MKYFLHLAYNGTRYRGWQRQAKVKSVQATIEDNLRKLFHSELTIHGCGRTDAGVHASQYYAHFVVEQEIDFDLVYKLNRMLPNDIVIYDLLPVPPKANAQLDAIGRTYEYNIHLSKDPFLHNKSSCYDLVELDLEIMETATKLFPKYSDFRFFCLQPDSHNHTRCDLRSVEMFVNSSRDRIRLVFTADRFLRGMIRIIVGRLLEVGQGKISLEELEASLKLEKPNRWLKSAYPEGLYLAGVEYSLRE